MHQNKMWLGILAVIGAICLWFCAKTSHQVYEYLRFDERTKGTVESWSVEQIGSDRFVLRAVYGFHVGKTLFDGESTVPKFVFLNAIAAERRAAELSSEGWTVWYRSNNPERSCLGKAFPYKQCTYSLILIGVLVYFIFLGRMARRSDKYADG